MKKYHSFIPGLVAGIAGILLISWLTLQPKPPEKLLAIFPPATTPLDLFDLLSHTDSRMVGPAALPFTFIVQSSDPDIISSLHQAGAIFVLNAQYIGGCAGRKKGKFNESV